MSVGLTRALHIATTPAEREAAHELRIDLYAQRPAIVAVADRTSRRLIGRPRRAMSAEDMHRATETDALIGPPEEIVGRLKRLQAGGVEYVMVIDVGGSLSALRTFAREIMPSNT